MTAKTGTARGDDCSPPDGDEKLFCSALEDIVSSRERLYCNKGGGGDDRDGGKNEKKKNSSLPSPVRPEGRRTHWFVKNRSSSSRH